MKIPNGLWQRGIASPSDTARWHRRRMANLDTEIGAARAPNELRRAQRAVWQFIEELEQKQSQLRVIAREVESDYAQVRPKKSGRFGQGKISAADIEQEKSKAPP